MLRADMDRFLGFRHWYATRESFQGLPSRSWFEYSVHALEVGEFVRGIAERFMIEHHVKIFIGEWQIHKVSIEKLDQVTNSTLFRLLCRHCDVRFTDGQASDVNAIRLSQHDRHPSHATASI